LYGTASKNHPGVARLFKGGNQFVAGEIALVERIPSQYRQCQLTPAQSRFIFAHKGWSKVMSFHAHCPIHRGHEHIQMKALEDTCADGLYINPFIGPREFGNFLSDSIMLSYQTMLDLNLYPKGKVVLGGVTSYPRHAGPRETIFTALCSKNMGCSHFMTGSDQAEIESLNAIHAIQKFIESVGDFGIQIEFFDPIGYNESTAEYGSVADNAEMLSIDAEKIGALLCDGKVIPDWMMREVIQASLQSEIVKNQTLFKK